MPAVGANLYSLYECGVRVCLRTLGSASRRVHCTISLWWSRERARLWGDTFAVVGSCVGDARRRRRRRTGGAPQIVRRATA